MNGLVAALLDKNPITRPDIDGVLQIPIVQRKV
jgi:hypothetical protein